MAKRKPDMQSIASLESKMEREGINMRKLIAMGDERPASTRSDGLDSVRAKDDGAS